MIVEYVNVQQVINIQGIFVSVITSRVTALIIYYVVGLTTANVSVVSATVNLIGQDRFATASQCITVVIQLPKMMWIVQVTEIVIVVYASKCHWFSFS